MKEISLRIAVWKIYTRNPSTNTLIFETWPSATHEPRLHSDNASSKNISFPFWIFREQNDNIEWTIFLPLETEKEFITVVFQLFDPVNDSCFSKFLQMLIRTSLLFGVLHHKVQYHVISIWPRKTIIGELEMQIFPLKWILCLRMPCRRLTCVIGLMYLRCGYREIDERGSKQFRKVCLVLFVYFYRFP